MHIKTVTAALIALFLTACNPMAQMETSEAEIATFHERYNEGNSRALYGMTGQEFRDVTTVEQMDQLVALVTDKMGAVEATERAGFNINTHNGQTTTVITMTTEFAKGEGTETFTFYGSGEDMRLVGWNVDSANFLDVPEEAVTEVETAE